MNIDFFLHYHSVNPVAKFIVIFLVGKKFMARHFVGLYLYDCLQNAT